jgi:hypothetical protein
MTITYPTPKREGWFWAKLVHPTRMPPGEDWASVDWEIVQVIENSLDDDSDEKWGVSVTGVSPLQWPQDFVWGPEVVRPAELA